MHVGGCSSCCIYCCCAERVHFLLHLFAIFIIYFISLLHSDFFIYIFVWLCESHFQRQLQLNRKPKCLREQLLCCCCWIDKSSHIILTCINLYMWKSSALRLAIYIMKTTCVQAYVPWVGPMLGRCNFLKLRRHETSSDKKIMAQRAYPLQSDRRVVTYEWYVCGCTLRQVSLSGHALQSHLRMLALLLTARSHRRTGWCRHKGYLTSFVESTVA